MAELEPFVDFYKVASYELLVTDLLQACARSGKPVVLSTGMATMDEIAKAAATLTEAGATDVTLLHCVSAYPTPAQEANLFRHPPDPRRHGPADRLVRPYPPPRRDRTRGASLERGGGGIPSRSGW